jgi:hypothetical protein
MPRVIEEDALVPSEGDSFQKYMVFYYPLSFDVGSRGSERD